VIGGTPTVMAHPIAGYEDCISCHGLKGIAMVLVDQTVHPCNQCHALTSSPQFPSHDSTMATNLQLLNQSCILCHEPAS
jgi:nitrate/TMAO reductase-like tetraheme cytochrome c subunit